MFKKMFGWLVDKPSDLEAYILSKHPQNAAEVDYWTICYGYQRNGGWL